MERFFNTAGPVQCDIHYCLPPLERWDLEQILFLIRQRKYFVLHAPRQTGKTSCLLALMAHLNAGREFHALYANLEMAQAARENVAQGMNDTLRELALRADYHLEDDFLERHLPEFLKAGAHGTALNKALARWCKALDKPLVLFLDEVDSLVGDTLISLLRQLRAGYDRRPRAFPQSIILCGVRDVRDYRIHSSAEKTVITGGSAFNIKAQSLRLGDFSREEVGRLLAMHKEETGQEFTPEAEERIWAETRGQPWLVNALAYETCFERKEDRDRSVPVTEEQVEAARERLILRRDTHLDQLVDKLQEDRVWRVISPILTASETSQQLRPDDVAYVADLGLVLVSKDGEVSIANPIYQEIIPRELSWTIQMGISQETEWYVAPDGRLDMAKLLSAFQEFFREHSEHWVERFDYKEAGPQLLLQAFLQRVVNSGGRIEREYGLGRGRTDLLVIWPFAGGVQKVVIELKVLHKSLERTVAEGLVQTAEYMDRCGVSEGHLVIFDRTEGRTWEEKIFDRVERVDSREIRVWGM